MSAWQWYGGINSIALRQRLVAYRRSSMKTNKRQRRASKSAKGGHQAIKIKRA